MYAGEELRFYCFTNYYLSDIQHGIQTGHAAVRLVTRYALSTKRDNTHHALKNLVFRWAENYETFITLNGGNNASLTELAELASKSGLPWVTFHEDEQSLGGLLTAVGVVVPESMFDVKREKDDEGFDMFHHEKNGSHIWWNRTFSVQYDFIKALKSRPLA